MQLDYTMDFNHIRSSQLICLLRWLICFVPLFTLITTVQAESGVIPTIPRVLNDVIDDILHLTPSVSIEVSPSLKYYGKLYVSTGLDLNVVSNFPIPQNRNASSLIYKWSTKDTNITVPTNATSIKYKFSVGDVDNFFRLNILDKDANNSVVATGQVDFGIQNPVIVADPAGKLILEHGELLNIQLKYNGSTPFSYCYKFCYSPDDALCNFCFPYRSTDAHSISITYYLHAVGNYTLMFDISNMLGHQTKHYTIKITEAARKQEVAYVPIVSSIFAVVILLTGVALHLHFRKTAIAETADFDFIRGGIDDEDWEEELSFMKRVRYFLRRDDHDDDEQRPIMTSNHASRGYET